MSIRSILSFSSLRVTRHGAFSKPQGGHSSHVTLSQAEQPWIPLEIPRWSSTSLKIRTANVESPASTILHRICHLSLCFSQVFPVFFSHRDAGSCAAELVAHVGPALPRLHHHGLPPVLGEGWDPWGPKTSTGVKTPGDTRRVKSRPNNNSCGPRNRCFTMFYWSCDELVTASFHGFFGLRCSSLLQDPQKRASVLRERTRSDRQVTKLTAKVSNSYFCFTLKIPHICVYIYIYVTIRMSIECTVYYIYTYVTHWLIIEIANSQKKMIVICDPLGLRQASNEETSTRGSVVDPADSAFDHDSLQTICM